MKALLQSEQIRADSQKKRPLLGVQPCLWLKFIAVKSKQVSKVLYFIYRARLGK